MGLGLGLRLISLQRALPIVPYQHPLVRLGGRSRTTLVGVRGRLRVRVRVGVGLGLGLELVLGLGIGSGLGLGAERLRRGSLSRINTLWRPSLLAAAAALAATRLGRA